MPPPKAIVCHICNGKYFSRSFPIHLKQCEEKWKKTHSRCEYCGTAVADHDWSDHRAHCKPSKKRRSSTMSSSAPLQVPTSDFQQLIPSLKNTSKVVQCQECETENAIWKCVQCEQSLCAMCEVELHRKGARSRHTRIPMTAKALQQENLSVLTQNDEKQAEEALAPPTADATTDARAQCKFCSRRFNPDRAEKHMRICANSQRKASRRRVWDAAKRRIQGTAFEEFQYNRSSTPPQIKEWKKASRRWKQESAQLREIAAINNDIKVTREHADKKDEENEVVIKAPANRPVFRKPEPATSVSGISASSKSKWNSKPTKRRTFISNRAPKELPLKGSSVKMKERPPSNTSSKSNSLRGSARKMNKRPPVSRQHKVEQDTVSKESSSRQMSVTGSSNVRARRQSSISVSSKPTASRFESRRAAKPNPNPSPNPNPRRVQSLRSKKSSEPKTKPRSEPEQKVEDVSPKKAIPVPVQKENNAKTQQATFKRRKSEASSLQRGADLGMNVKQMFGDKPTTMDDYLERERVRRENRKSGAAISTSTSMRSNKPTSKSAVPIQRMSRLQIKKEIKIENQAIGGKRANKPSDATDLASKRAAYFESLLQNDQD